MTRDSELQKRIEALRQRIVDLKRRIENAHGSIKPKDEWIA